MCTLQWRHSDVISVKNSFSYKVSAYEVILMKYWNFIDNFFKNAHQNTPVYQILPFYLEKQQSYKAFHITYNDVIMTS